MSDYPTIRRDAINLTGIPDTEAAAIRTAAWVWIETVPGGDGRAFGRMMRVIDAEAADESVLFDRYGDRWQLDAGGWRRMTFDGVELSPSAGMARWSRRGLDRAYGPLRVAESDA